jgi:hypothetical protein
VWLGRVRGCCPTNTATVGDLRELESRQVGSALAEHRAVEPLLLSTDADAMVDAHWALAHLRLAERGWHAVAGAAEFARPLPPMVAAGYATGRTRADAYAAVGGFAPSATGGDQDL